MQSRLGLAVCVLAFSFSACGDDVGLDVVCSDGVLSPGESDVDCGGLCGGCGVGLVCYETGDCESGVCGDGNRCLVSTCGDGVTNGLESDVDCGGLCNNCNPGDACVQGEDCDSKICSVGVCTQSMCGDGVQNGDDECDDGGESIDCDSDCTVASCGDEQINMARNEDCDDGGETANCDGDCTTVSCSDMYTNEAAGEECDGGGVDTADCNYDCTEADCGDSYTNNAAGEDCDDAGDDTANCDADCTDVDCGDGHTNVGAGEDCDDSGESVNCDANCTTASCGDGIINATRGEECEIGSGCDQICHLILDEAGRNKNSCFQFANTAGEDLTDHNWFDNCVAAQDQNDYFILSLFDDNGDRIYSSFAPTGAVDWTQDNVTSTAAAVDQIDRVNHDRLLTLANGDAVAITGKLAEASACGGAIGSGYGIRVYPPDWTGQYYEMLKMLVMTFRFNWSPNDPRDIPGWDASKEISYNGTALFASCAGVVPTNPNTPVVAQLGRLQIALVPGGSSCKEIKTNHPSAGDGMYVIDVDGSGGASPAHLVYCDMTTDGGGWTLLLKAGDGGSSVFLYDSGHWTNVSTVNPTDSGFNQTEAKVEAYNTLGFSEVMVGLTMPEVADGTYRKLSFNIGPQTSMLAVMQGGYINSGLGRAAWHGLGNNGAGPLQANCNQEGINVNPAGGDPFARVRIGILGNNEMDCDTPDSYIGIGGAGTACGIVPLGAGASSRCESYPADGDYPGMGYLFVR
jgi:hypothetical protein